MGKYFGTDGVRGIANTQLTAELAFKLGRYGGYYLSQHHHDPKIVVGRDTRISGEMLESALTAGLLSAGINVVKLGVLPTPAVAYMTRQLNACGGIMISASHNPFEDNGIKFFGGDGFKLLDEIEEQIEASLEKEDVFPRPVGASVGRILDYYEGTETYSTFLKSTIDHSFSGLRIVLDCANGAASTIAADLFSDLGAEVFVIANQPDGININVDCGSTHPEKLQQMVLEKQADIGLAFDGDADRLIAVNEKGELVDGDAILYICGKYLKAKNKLKKNTIVATVMSNFGFKKALDAEEMITKQTSVGDRYVMEEMIKNGYNLGGEQSGHLIFLDHNTTGDGVLSALQLVNVVVESKQSLSELSSGFKQFPQLLVNVKVQSKEGWDSNEEIQTSIQEGESLLGENGRILVRPSGTESLIRVMAEGPDDVTIKDIVEKIAATIQEECS
jgi:phosphoglucosamine mutase